MAGDGTLEDGKGAGLAGVRGGVANLEAAAPAGPEALEGLLPVCVGEEVGRGGAGGNDQMFEVGPLGNKCADLVLH